MIILQELYRTILITPRSRLAVASQHVVMAGFSFREGENGSRVIRNRVMRNVLINTLLMRLEKRERMKKGEVFWRAEKID